MRQSLVATLLTLFLSFSILIPQSLAIAATNGEGLKCSKTNQIVKSGKQSFICTNTIAGKVWVKSAELSSKITKLKSQAMDIVDKLSFIDSSTVSSFLKNTEATQAAINEKAKKSEDLSTSLLTANSDKKITDGEIVSLPSRINSAYSKLSQAQSALTVPQQNYTNLLTQLNALSYEYSTAYSAKSSYLACRVLNDFGFQAGGCGSYNSYYDVVISKYNALNTQVNAAKSTYDFYKGAYDLSYKEYTELVNSKNKLSEKSSTLTQTINTIKDELAENVKELDRLNVMKDKLELFAAKQTYYDEAPSRLTSAVSSVLSQKSSAWYKKLQPIFREFHTLIYELSLISS